MKTAALQMVSWIMVMALAAPLALPTTASSTYVKLGGG